MTYKRKSYSGLFQGSPVSPFQGVPGVDIEIVTMKTIGSLYLLKPFTNALADPGDHRPDRAHGA